MRAFDLLAEAKMRQWERNREQRKDEPVSKSQFVFDASCESFEKQLFDDIRRLILRSHREDAETRAQTLRQAEKIHVQLSARLERNGCFHLSQHVFAEISRLKKGDGKG